MSNVHGASSKPIPNRNKSQTISNQAVSPDSGKPQAKQAVPSNATVKVPLTALLDRDVAVEQADEFLPFLEPAAAAPIKFEKEIANFSEKMQVAADKYTASIKHALALEGDARKKALDNAKETLSSDMKTAFADVELRGLKEEIDSLTADIDNDFWGNILVLQRRLDYAQSLYNLAIFTEALTDRDQLSKFQDQLKQIRDIAKGQSPKSLQLDQLDWTAIPSGEKIRFAMSAINDANNNVARTIGFEAYEYQKLASVCGWLAVVTLLTGIGGFLFGILWGYYSSKGEDADKKLDEWLKTHRVSSE